jgi:chromosome segregation ATPase
MMKESFKLDEFGFEEQPPEEVDVQKVVVEELASEKIALEDKLSAVSDELSSVKKEKEILQSQVSEKSSEIEKLSVELSAALLKIEELKSEIAKIGTLLSEQEEKGYEEQSRKPNQLALLDRDVEVPDRFAGETRDHVIEVLRDARDKAEKEGRVRLAQVLEGVLVNNEPNGLLAGKRKYLQDIFSENMHIVNGVVIEKLNEMNISYKKGEDFLSPDEILKRNF